MVAGGILLVGLVVVVMRTIWVGPDKKATLVDAKDATIVDESVENLCERTRGEIDGPGVVGGVVEGGELCAMLKTPNDAAMCVVEELGESACACLTAIVHVGGDEWDDFVGGHSRKVGKIYYCCILKME